MRYILSISFILLITTLTSCSKKDNPGSKPGSGSDPEKPPATKLSITAFNPKSATIGTTVMITGTAFGTDSDRVSIKFGNSARINPKTITENKITAIVPKDASTGKIEITINGTSVSSADDFKLTETPPPSPTITDFLPNSAQVGELVTINGTGFLTDTNFVSISFGNSNPVKPYILTSTKLIVKVPKDAQTGKIKVVINGATPLITSETFTFKPLLLAISNFSPQSAQPASKITITGTGFGSDPSVVQVAIGTSPYDHPISVSPTTLVIETNLATPSGKISVIVNGNKVTSANDFTALPQDLKIIGFNLDVIPKLGSQYYIYAQGFGTDASKMKFSFGGTTPVNGNYIGPAKMSIGTVIPRYAPQSGKVTLTVGNKSTTSDQSLNLAMSMRDFSPKTFSSGDTVKITGIEFTNVNDMAIHFNALTDQITRPFKVTPTEMLVIVPTNAISGYLEITANLGIDNDIFIEEKYTFVPTVSFNNFQTPSSGQVNDIIQINGNFAGADISTIGVSFGGSKPVQPISIAGSNIAVKIPSDAKTGKITISRKDYKSFTGSFIFTILP